MSSEEKIKYGSDCKFGVMGKLASIHCFSRSSLLEIPPACGERYAWIFARRIGVSLLLADPLFWSVQSCFFFLLPIVFVEEKELHGKQSRILAFWLVENNFPTQELMKLEHDVCEKWFINYHFQLLRSWSDLLSAAHWLFPKLIFEGGERKLTSRWRVQTCITVIW